MAISRSDQSNPLASATAAMRSFALTGLLPWVRKLGGVRAVGAEPRHRVALRCRRLVRADIGELYTALLKGRQGGWLSPNDCRSETGFPTVANGNDIAPPVSGGLPADTSGTGDTPRPTTVRRSTMLASPPSVTASRGSTTGGPVMATTDTVLEAAEFTPIRGQLARAFIANKASMGLGDASDEWILAHVDDICLVLSALTDHAIAIDDRPWLRRHVWWRALAYCLRNNLSGAPLDGYARTPSTPLGCRRF